MKTAAKSHGMDGTLVEPEWPPLTLEEVRTVLARLRDGGEPIEILSVSPRPFSAASVVSTLDEPVFIKRHHRAVRDRKGLAEEHRYIEHLRNHGVQVPRVRESASRETAIELGQWTYEVHEVPFGEDIYADAHSWTPFRSLNHASSAGRALGLLHLASRGFQAPARRPRPLVASFSIFSSNDPAAAMMHYLSARPALGADRTTGEACAEALELLEPFHAELAPLLPALDPLWTHNDLHASNLLWSDGSDAARAAAIIDFGLADRTNAVHDLALAIERNIVEWLALAGGHARPDDVPVHIADLRAMLDGYESARPLSREEAAALAPMLALCHAEFALSEADYFLGVLHSREKARLATNDYLVGHARWFHSNAGTRLLDWLRRWSSERRGNQRAQGR